MEFDTMTEHLALQIIDACDAVTDSERVLQAYQYLLDTEAYLHLPNSYERTIENLVEQGLIG
jgi:hypothetical protein